MSDRSGQAAKTSSAANLDWLVRYARHCGFTAGVQHGANYACRREEAATRSRQEGQTEVESVVQALRRAFGPPAWRLVCRSPKERFLPILRNRELSLHSLIAYCKRLACRSFICAPQPELLSYFVTQRRRFLNMPCRVPEDSDYNIIRVADREVNLRIADIALVVNWALQANVCIQSHDRWTALVRRARLFREAERVRLLAARQSPWTFFCSGVTWRGYSLEPLTNSLQLWEEGLSQGNCLYQLRKICDQDRPSRFFSVRRDGRRLATLELAWRPPERGDRGMDREWGHWYLLDLRLSYNRLPDDRLREAMHAFAWMFNLWAKRPGRIRWSGQGSSGDARSSHTTLASSASWTPLWSDVS